MTAPGRRPERRETHGSDNHPTTGVKRGRGARFPARRATWIRRNRPPRSVGSRGHLNRAIFRSKERVSQGFSVALPIATTRAVAGPLTAEVASQTIPAGSISATCVLFSAGSDSPHRRFLHVQVTRRLQPRIRGHEVTGSQADHLARPGLQDR